MIIHVVKPGESLWTIANRYGVSLPRLIDVNDLPQNRLVPGLAVLVPTEDAYHIVKPGETLFTIARSYGTTIQAIVRDNQLTNPNSLEVGQRLYIRARRHTVQRGETLGQIAQRYGVTLQNLMKVNDIDDPDEVFAGTVLVIPRIVRPTIDVNGYVIQFGERGAQIIREDGPFLTYMSPFAYMIKENGELDTIDDSPIIREAYAQDVVPMMSITNFTSTELGENLAHAVLSSPQVTETLLTNVIRIMKDKGYRGLNIDFENVLPADRENYNRFIQRAVDRLKPEGFFVSSALAPKTGPEQKGLLYEAHDYPAHGRILDFVVLMTYEWGYRFGPPQAISPLNEIKRVMDYAVTVIPRNKIFFGFQIYARDWLLPHKQGQEAKTFSVQQAIELAINKGATIQYDKKTESPFFRYTDEQGRRHEVWFEDARSAQAKFEMVKEYGLRGISYWVLGYPFPQNWELLDDTFTIRKRL